MLRNLMLAAMLSTTIAGIGASAATAATVISNNVACTSAATRSGCKATQTQIWKGNGLCTLVQRNGYYGAGGFTPNTGAYWSVLGIWRC